MARMTHRERMAVVLCLLTIFGTAGYYLGYRQYQAYREGLEIQIQEKRELLASYKRLLQRAAAIHTEKIALRESLAKSSAFFMKDDGTLAAQQSRLVSQIKKLAPDVELRTSGGTTGRFGRNDDRVSVRFSGHGTLGQMTRLLHNIESHRDPLLFVDALSFSARSSQANPRRRTRGKPEPTKEEKDMELTLSLTVYALLDKEAK